MKNRMLALFALALSTSAFTKTLPYLEENIYFNFQKQILAPETKMNNLVNFGFSSFEQGLMVDALWDLVEENSPEAMEMLNNEIPVYYDLVQKFRLGILKVRYQTSTSIPTELVEEVENALRQPEAETKLIYLVAAYEADLIKNGYDTIVSLAQAHEAYNDIADSTEKKEEITTEIVADLFHETPDTTTYMNGEYVKSVKLFMFCRTNRLYPCLMVMKDVHGEPVRLEDGTLWSQASLGSSARGLPSYTRNGNTPEGIYTMDSVMPYADQVTSFGKFRRVILNFIPKASNEKHIKSLLPASSHKSEWWKPSVVARDAGRNLFRIHGTGKINKDPSTPYYPFMRTSGCVAQRENTYEGVTYKDQRLLLDQMMKSLELTPVYANETQVKGFLYVMELDDAQEAVTLEDLRMRGIE